MTTEIDEIVIKGITYVPKGNENQNADLVDNMSFVLIRGLLFWCTVWLFEKQNWL